MTAVVLDVNLSLDGFAAAPGSRPGQPLGDGGDRLREWAMGPEVGRTPKPAASAGALICGRRTYETSLPEWGAGGPHSPTPVFVVTHQQAKLAKSIFVNAPSGLVYSLRLDRAPGTKEIENIFSGLNARRKDQFGRTAVGAQEGSDAFAARVGQHSALEPGAFGHALSI